MKDIAYKCDTKGETMSGIRLSETEKKILQCIQNVKCLSYAQIEDICVNFLDVKESRVVYVLHSLVKCQALQSKSPDEKGYFVSGVSCYHTEKDIDKNIIKAMYYVIASAGSIDEITGAYLSINSDVAVTFTHEGRCYEIIPISIDSLHIATKAQKRFKQEYTKGLKAMKIYPFIPVFMFNDGEDIDDILEAMEILDLSIPHKIIVMKGKNPAQKLDFSEFDATEITEE